MSKRGRERRSRPTTPVESAHLEIPVTAQPALGGGDGNVTRGCSALCLVQGSSTTTTTTPTTPSTAGWEHRLGIECIRIWDAYAGGRPMSSARGEGNRGAALPSSTRSGAADSRYFTARALVQCPSPLRSLIPCSCKHLDARHTGRMTEQPPKSHLVEPAAAVRGSRSGDRAMTPPPSGGASPEKWAAPASPSVLQKCFLW